MWEATRLDKGYQSVAMTVKKKTGEEVYKTISKAAIKECVGLGIERMSVIKKGNSMIFLMDQTRIVVPQTMRKMLMDREQLPHQGINKMSRSIRVKYFWPGIEAYLKRMVEGCELYQLHMRSQARDRHRPPFEYVSRSMQAIGIDFFERHENK